MQGSDDLLLQHLHSRVLGLFLICAAAYGLLACRFVYLQAIPHGKDLVDRDLRVQRVAARRGQIYDRNGIPLAVSVDGYDVWVRPNLIRRRNLGTAIAPQVSSVLGIPESVVEQKLSLAKPFAFIARRVSASLGMKVLALNLEGVGADRVFLRSYPKAFLASHVLGRVNTDGSGTAGLELGYNSELQGKDGWIQYRVDGKNQHIPGTEIVQHPVQNGQDLRLTLDARIQQVAEEQLEKALEAHHAAAGCTVVLDVKTGQILAIANRPTFNPNLPVTNMGALLDRAISYAYEPGSTMKMVTASGALTEGAWTLKQTVTCSGTMAIGNRRIHCVVEPPYHGGHGTETIRDVIRNSCNIGAATIGMKLGAAKLSDYIRRFGLLDRPHIGLPGAVSYRLAPPETWARIRLANIAFGQGIMITPLQLVEAYAAIANGGVLMKPELVSATVNPDTGDISQSEPKIAGEVVPLKTAIQVADLLKAVVYDGTGKTAEIPGYEVAGKTGSAQKAGAHGYLSGEFIASFVGFAPASDPRVACITMVDEPQGIHWGAVVSAPVVREVLRWSLHYLQVPPDAPDLTGDGGDFKTVRQMEHLGIPLPGTREWAASHGSKMARPALPPHPKAATRVGTTQHTGAAGPSTATRIGGRALSPGPVPRGAPGGGGPMNRTAPVPSPTSPGSGANSALPGSPSPMSPSNAPASASERPTHREPHKVVGPGPKTVRLVVPAIPVPASPRSNFIQLLPLPSPQPSCQLPFCKSSCGRRMEA